MSSERAKRLPGEDGGRIPEERTRIIESKELRIHGHGVVGSLHRLGRLEEGRSHSNKSKNKSKVGKGLHGRNSIIWKECFC